MAQIKFTNPPINELIFNISFDSAEFTVAHLGSFWEVIRKDYPLTSTHQPIVLLAIEGEPYPLIPRSWFEDTSKNYLVQLQKDRLIFNWRQINLTDKYPDFDNVFNKFKKILDLFTIWAQGSFKAFAVAKYDLTYINHIDDLSGWHSPADTKNILKIFHNQVGSKRNKLMSASTQYESPTDPSTTLSLSLKQGFKTVDKKPVAVLELSASKLGDGREILDWFEKANSMLNKEFIDLTTDDAHKKWGKV